VRGFRYITADLLGSLEKPASVTLKIRHTPEFAVGTLQQIAENNKDITGQTRTDMYVLQSETPLQGIASGQFAVIYDRKKQLCLGSGIIA
jgi:tRNA-specific 2-thiouridylase